MTVLDTALLVFVIALYTAMLISDARWQHTYGKIGHP